MSFFVLWEWDINWVFLKAELFVQSLDLTGRAHSEYEGHDKCIDRKLHVEHPNTTFTLIYDSWMDSHNLRLSHLFDQK